jgi:preprotein translocase subunit SecD
MLFFSRWKVAVILLTAGIICLFAVPNFFSENTLRNWPSWAQRHIVLGLDLQGGSSLLLEVDVNAVRKDKLQAISDDVLRILRQNRIQFTGRAIKGNSVEVRITRDSDVENAVSKLRELSQPVSSVMGSTGQRSVDISESGGLITLTPTEPALVERVRQTVDQSIQIIERRVNELGLVEPIIQRQGASRILVQVPGLQDPSRLKEIIGKTAKLDFRMVDLSMTPEQALASHPPADSEILDGEGGSKYLIDKRVLVSGGDLVDAQPGFDQRNGQPIVNFRFNSSGARKFAEVTKANVGKPFAIVLDNKVISAPVINEPIPGGAGQISGNFTVQSANDLAILLRAGALPAPLTVVEERTVGPGLGQDSINAGERAAYAGAALVVIFMLVTYGLFGLFANVAVAVNVAMIFGLLSLLGATLTLPGIAGIVLTVGIAVDSNVLIYERIREEVRAGPPSARSMPGSRARSRPFSTPISPRSSRRRCCSISGPGRCAALP